MKSEKTAKNAKNVQGRNIVENVASVTIEGLTLTGVRIYGFTDWRTHGCTD